MSSVVLESSMSMRTKMPRASASRRTRSVSDRHSAESTFSPSAVSLTETFAVEPVLLDRRERVVVGAGDRLGLLGTA